MIYLKYAINVIISVLPYLRRLFDQYNNKYIQVIDKSGGTHELNNFNIVLKTDYAKMKMLYAKHGGLWDEINIGGIKNIDNSFDDNWNDTLFIAFDGKFIKFRGTTDPSVYWTNNKNRAKHGWEPGAAHLCIGFHNKIYQVGRHRNKYEALVQYGGPVKYWVDLNENFKNDENIIRNRYIGANLHHGNNARKIGIYGGACQVLKSSEDLKLIMGIVKKSKSYADKKYKFSYMMFDKSQIPISLRVI